MLEVVLLGDGTGVGALAGTRRAEEDVILHGLFVNNVDVSDVAAELVVVESETDDEGVGNLHAHVIQLDRLVVHFRLEEHRGDAHLGGAFLVQEHFLEGDDGVAGVHDVLADDDAPATYARGQAHHVQDGAGGLGALVGGQLDGNELAGKINTLQQLARERNGAVQHAQDDRDVGAAVEVGVDFPGYGVDGVHDALMADVRPEGLVVDLDFFVLHDGDVSLNARIYENNF